MSERNVRFIRAAFDAFSRGDFEAVLQVTDPDIEITQPRELPDYRTYHGREGVLEAFRDWPAQWDQFDVDLVDVIDLDDEHVVSVTRQHLRARELEFDQDVINLHTFRGEKAIGWHMFFTVEEAMEAARAAKPRPR
ncbi:MAG TPA: nuclear transport factor 2 family protein [Thermoleophilaceae bacterium]